MPRIRPRVFYQARAIHPYLPLLLPTCKDLSSTRNELRWLREHARHVSKQLNRGNHHTLLKDFVTRRSHGEPLQYILQSTFFGDLEIRCRPGVLIPRQDTAASVTYLVQRLCRSLDRSNNLDALPKLRVLDLCTGTGCIPLLFHHEFYQTLSMKDVALELVGADISTRALSLARENLIFHIAAQATAGGSSLQRTASLQSIGFVHADVLDSSTDATANSNSIGILKALRRLHSDDTDPEYDVLIANPPYISPFDFQYTTSRSVRQFEPELALVPPVDVDRAAGDHFYPRLLQIAEQVNVSVALFEVADLEQAKRVARMALEQGCWSAVEIWRDDPSAAPAVVEHVELDGKSVKVVGAGNGRSVFISKTCTKSPEDFF